MLSCCGSRKIPEFPGVDLPISFGEEEIDNAAGGKDDPFKGAFKVDEEKRAAERAARKEAERKKRKEAEAERKRLEKEAKEKEEAAAAAEAAAKAEREKGKRGFANLFGKARGKFNFVAAVASAVVAAKAKGGGGAEGGDSQDGGETGGGAAAAAAAAGKLFGNKFSAFSGMLKKGGFFFGKEEQVILKEGSKWRIVQARLKDIIEMGRLEQEKRGGGGGGSKSRFSLDRRLSSDSDAIGGRFRLSLLHTDDDVLSGSIIKLGPSPIATKPSDVELARSPSLLSMQVGAINDENINNVIAAGMGHPISPVAEEDSGDLGSFVASNNSKFNNNNRIISSDDENDGDEAAGGGGGGAAKKKKSGEGGGGVIGETSGAEETDNDESSVEDYPKECLACGNNEYLCARCDYIFCPVCHVPPQTHPSVPGELCSQCYPLCVADAQRKAEEEAAKNAKKKKKKKKKDEEDLSDIEAGMRSARGGQKDASGPPDSARQAFQFAASRVVKGLDSAMGLATKKIPWIAHPMPLTWRITAAVLGAVVSIVFSAASYYSQNTLAGALVAAYPSILFPFSILNSASDSTLHMMGKSINPLMGLFCSIISLAAYAQNIPLASVGCILWFISCAWSVAVIVRAACARRTFQKQRRIAKQRAIARLARLASRQQSIPTTIYDDSSASTYTTPRESVNGDEWAISSQQSTPRGENNNNNGPLYSARSAGGNMTSRSMVSAVSPTPRDPIGNHGEGGEKNNNNKKRRKPKKKDKKKGEKKPETIGDKLRQWQTAYRRAHRKRLKHLRSKFRTLYHVTRGVVEAFSLLVLFFMVFLQISTCFHAIASQWLVLGMPGVYIQGGDGTKLHVICQGVRQYPTQPVVIFESMELIGQALMWENVLPQVATFAKACSYDRAGYGWSPASTKARTAAQIATELDGMLTNLGEEPPFVLVGHSVGSLYTRQYAAMYGTKVAGLIGLDAAIANPRYGSMDEVQPFVSKVPLRLLQVCRDVLEPLGVIHFVAQTAITMAMANLTLLPSLEKMEDLMMLHDYCQTAFSETGELYPDGLEAIFQYDNAGYGDKPVVMVAHLTNLDGVPVTSTIPNVGLSWLQLQNEIAQGSPSGTVLVAGDHELMIATMPAVVAEVVHSVLKTINGTSDVFLTTPSTTTISGGNSSSSTTTTPAATTTTTAHATGTTTATTPAAGVTASSSTAATAAATTHSTTPATTTTAAAATTIVPVSST